MDEKEKKELIGKIMNVDNDPKMARVATTVFINKASKEEAAYFLDYLDHSNPAVVKIARSILGQLAVPEAVNKLIDQFFEIVKNLTFMPDAEYTEATYYANLIEILEALFIIMKNTNQKNEDFLKRITEIFKRTKNEDLRFTLIKLIGMLGDSYDYFMKYFDDLTEKERRALYYVYSFVDDPRRDQLFKRGLMDDKNLDYVVASMLSFKEGKETLSQELLSLSNYNKQVVLKKLQEGVYPEFNETLIKFLSDKNKFLVELAIENLKRSISADASLDPFIKAIEEGYSPESIQGSLEIIDYFVKKNPEDIYISGLEKQPSYKNKHIILDFFIEKLKKKIKVTEELADKVVPKLLVHFDNYSKEKEDLFLSIFKVVSTFRYSSAGKVRGIKKKILGFAKEFDKRLSNTFKNNLSEFLVKLNQMIGRFEEAESKKKNIVLLFDIDATKVEHSRMMKLRDQLNELSEYIDEATLANLVTFLGKLVSTPKVDWKVKTIALDLLAVYGGIKEIPILTTLLETETSLAVKTNAQKALKKIEETHADSIQSVLIMEPLFYLQKILNEYFKAKAFRVFDLKEYGKFAEVCDKPFKYVVVSENILTPEFTQELLDYMDENMESILVIVTAKPESLSAYQDLPNVKLLKKPFKSEALDEVVTEY